MKFATIAFALAAVLTTTSAMATDNYSGTLAPRSASAKVIHLTGGEDFSIYVRGSVEGGDIDCELYDDGGHKVAEDADETNSCLIEGAPRRDGIFYVRILNHSRVRQNWAMRITQADNG